MLDLDGPRHKDKGTPYKASRYGPVNASSPEQSVHCAQESAASFNLSSPPDRPALRIAEGAPTGDHIAVYSLRWRERHWQHGRPVLSLSFATEANRPQAHIPGPGWGLFGSDGIERRYS